MKDDETSSIFPLIQKRGVDARRRIGRGGHHLNASDIRGLSRLALDAARMITDVVENMHATVLGQLGVPLPAPSKLHGDSPRVRTGGVPGLVYRSVHAGYDAVEAGVRIGTRLFDPPSGNPRATPERERVLGVLNGVWGHHLAATKNPLAIEMSFRHAGVSLVMERSVIRTAIGAPGRRLLVLNHGLCMSDLSWRQVGHDHGELLARDLGYTPIYLHYNTGLHISTNGKLLAALLERLAQEWPEPIEELNVLGHSMGGLVARSAIYYGQLEKHTWLGYLRRLVFLGTPHHGSRLERAGSWADQLLDATPYTAPMKRLGASRSAGIRDLRHGSIVDEDWEGGDRLTYRQDTRRPVPLPAGVQCYALAATLGTKAGDAKGRLLGDGLVPLNSALGIHRDPRLDLALPPSHRWTGYAMNHLDLLRSPEVYGKLQEWLRP